MQPYFFGLTICSSRTGAPLAKKTGVVFASNLKEAETLAWENMAVTTPVNYG